MDLDFTKMQGCGNDFVVIDDRAGEWDFDPDAVTLLCDRHFGIGADGVIFVRPAAAAGADFRMDIVNADGSTAEMCGNGARLFARYVVERGLAEGDVVNVETLAGPRPVTVLRDEDGRFDLARVGMGRPIFDAATIPTTLGGDPVMDASVHTEAGDAVVTCVSMGNPHAVIWVEDVDAAPVSTLGPLVERNAAFPRGTNVEFAQVLGKDDAGMDRIRLRVWERGVGETLACGTGACATAVAGALSARTGRDVIVELPGGDLTISWTPDGEVLMTGPAEEVFTGVLSIPDEE